MGTLRKCIPKHILQEILDLKNIPACEYTKSSNTEYEFVLNDDIVHVTFDKFSECGVDPILNISGTTDWYSDGLKYASNPDDLYNVGYTVNGTDIHAGKRSYKIFISIIKTVMEIVNDFVANNKPFGLFVSSINKETGEPNDRQKDIVYRALAGTHFPPGYIRNEDVKVNYDDAVYNGFMLYKRLTRKEK